MHRRRNAITSKRPQAGAATVEYVVATVLVAVLLFGNPSVARMLVDAIKQLYRAFTFALSQTIH